MENCFALRCARICAATRGQRRGKGWDWRTGHERIGNTAINLGATQYWPAIEQWHRDGLIDPDLDDIDNIRFTIFAGADARLDRMHKPRYIRDTAAEMSWWACFTEESFADDLSGCDDDSNNRHGDPLALPFVREQPKVGRNDPCPCGSGKKFKKCCGANL